MQKKLKQFSTLKELFSKAIDFFTFFAICNSYYNFQFDFLFKMAHFYSDAHKLLRGFNKRIYVFN